MTDLPPPVLVALHRFGLGARPGDPARLGDPRGAIAAQIDGAARPLVAAADLPASDAAYRALKALELRREEERMAPPPKGSVVAMAENAVEGLVGGQGGMMRPATMEQPIDDRLIRAEQVAAFRQLATAEAGLVERLVLFWSNHFAVSASKARAIHVLAGPFQREAIRPHVLGRFSDLLIAVETHPAMLVYLDANQSIGPGSRAGRSGRRGLNENLAREILELHSMGVGSGYTQADVTSLARIITGWTVVSPDDDETFGGRFTFAPGRHEPGTQSVLGVSYAQHGLDQGREALQALARHPATARHVCGKLAAHFVADEPPPDLVDRLARVYLDTDGDLAAVTRALVQSDEAWTLPLAKVRQPIEYVAAILRATGAPVDPGQVLGALSSLGQPLWDPPGPNGWPDTAAAWISPKGVDARLDVAAQWARQTASLDPKQMLDTVLGGAASEATRQAVSRAESRQQGLALLFMSPEFQRR